jgi:CheY-like chemotaxis protein
MEPVSTKPVILYAEDDFDDFESIKEALGQLSDQHVLFHAKNGHEAVSFIENSITLPSLVVLDLNMPVMNGKEVLLWLKEKDDFNHIPTMIFTTSSREEDVKLCQKHGCTFFRKPTHIIS